MSVGFRLAASPRNGWRSTTLNGCAVRSSQTPLRASGTAESWAARIETVQAGGMNAVRETVLERFFSPAFRNSRPEVVAATGETLVATDPGGYIGACAALRDADLRSAVAAIRVPSLILGGALDKSTRRSNPRICMKRSEAARSSYLIRRLICPIWSSPRRSTRGCCSSCESTTPN